MSNDAKSSAETQASNVENLISQGANVLIILAQDGTAIKPSVANALVERRAGHRVRPPHRGPGALYITFDNVEVGRLQADAIFNGVPKGNYIIIKGNKADANADFLRSGYDKVIKDAVTPATSRSSARPTRTTGIRPRPRPRPSSSSPRPTTTCRRSCRRTTGWPVASWPH